MSKSDMLAPIVRALVSVPQGRLGVVLDAVNKIGGSDGELWRASFAEVLRKGVGPETPVPEAPPNTIIRVDRSIRPFYPEWVKIVMDSELEATGPLEYDLSTIDLWLHDGQKNGRSVGGQVIYKYLKDEKMLEGCLSLRDGEEIQKKGLVIFQKFFQGKEVILWKSVVQSTRGRLSVPCLVVHGGYVVFDWYFLNSSWGGSYPAPRFAS